MPESQSRRLAAILAADIAGYSALMGADEARTVRDLKGHQTILLPMIGEFGGRIIDTAGDGLLAEFPSVVNAVKCAVAIQSKMAERNAPIEPERRMHFRIGINIGDLVYDEGRIYGEGINVAARLEGIAEPGGICISSKVYEEISGRIELTYEDIGAQQLKNIARPVRVYRVCRDSNAPAATAVLALPDKPSARPVRASNVPIRVPAHFMGRDEALAEIETALNRYEGRVAITALHGLRGVGKTTLAAAYAERHRSAYRVTWWIRAQTEPGMRADLVALGGRLGWVGLDDKEDRAVEVVMERLRHEGDGILLIFDNAVDADALKPYLPRGGAPMCWLPPMRIPGAGLQRWSKSVCGPRRSVRTTSSPALAARPSAPTPRRCPKFLAASRSPTSRQRPIASGSTSPLPNIASASRLRRRAFWMMHATRPVNTMMV
jgi:class 3 adenylate cyclase